MTRRRIARLSLAFLLMAASLLPSACNKIPKISISDDTVQVTVTSVPLQIVFAAGAAALQVAGEAYLGIDVQELLGQIVENSQASQGMPPSDAPVIMVINKQTNDMLYWKLTDKVKMIRLKHDEPGKIELKVVNEAPLRIELWMEGGLENIRIEVQMKE